MQRTLADAYRVQALQGQRLTAWYALHSATRGAALALGLGDQIGSLEPGFMADICLWDRAITTTDTLRQQCASSLHEQLFAWLLLSDDRHLASTWVAGVQQFQRGAS